MKPHRALRGAHLLGLLLAASSLVSCATSSASSASSSGIISDKQLKKQQQQQKQHTEEASHLQQKAESALVKSLESAANSVISEKNHHQDQLAASNQQPAAEKKQGDSAPQLQDSILSADEYVQIKPEEVSANEQVSGKELLDIQGNSNDAQQQQQQQVIAEHKSAVDDELDAHLAQDSISQQESAYRPTYSAAASALSAGLSAPSRPLGVYPPVVRAPAYRPAAPQRGPRSPARMPPSYITLKGKLTGFNSIISQYPHPAPGYPHQGPRHLPRGAAAGYAAFRDFVRAHASKYKHTTHLTSNSVGPHPQLAQSSYGAPEPQAPLAVPVPTRYAEQQSGAAGKGYAASSLSAGGYSNAPAAKTYRGQQQPLVGGSKTTKVTVAQAYIPHISGASSSYGQAAAQQSIAPYVNPVLAKMYGGHAPQGTGKAEYSKDYGMVIHYPQATVYTEPMTVDQLHKLTGAGISQVLEQLQYNLAHGHRDESNTIRAHSKHHLGHGVSIHAKEYYAPGKAGHYVPTTAAVLSTNGASAKGSSAAYGEQSAGAEGAGATYGPSAAAAQKPLDLGSGYERVKQAVANSQAKYNVAASAAPAKYSSQDYQSHDAEPLSAITSFLGSELESLYKANSALTKHLEPEIHQAVAKAASYHAKASPLKYTDLGMKSPFGPHGLPLTPAAPYSVPRPATRYQRGRGPRRSPQGGERYAQRPHAPGYQSNGQRPQQQQQQQHQYQQHGPRAQSYAQQQSYQQNQAYHAAEQALNQQVMQLIHDFQSGDDQYNSKSQPLHATNQGYPHKVMQKYQQQAYAQQQQQQQASYGQQQAAAYGANQQVSGYSLQQSLPYAHQDGLEIPQGSNDQIGEIADLIESLKGALDLNKPDGAEGNYANQPAGKQHKQEEVRYLASTLGQAPSYALQVPVSGSNNYQDKKPADSYQQQQSAYAAPAIGYQAEQQQAYQVQPEVPAAGYQQQAAAYGAAQSGGYGSAQQQQQQPQPASYQQQPANDYQNAAVAAGYASSAQPQAAQASQGAAGYQQAGAYQPTNGYQQSSGYQQQQQQQQQSAGSGYQQQQAVGYQAQVAAEQPASSYSVNEHAQVIDHLVPAAAPQQVAASSAAAAGYGHESSAASSSGVNHQPALQIGLTAPTDSHYQQAQSLSSFIDSLPTDYQEILRQPALLDGHSNVSHLAIQEGASSTSSHYTNATSAAAAAPVASASSSSSSSSATHSSYDVHQPVQQQQAQQQQAYEQTQSGKSASTSGSSTAVASQQYSTVKK